MGITHRNVATILWHIFLQSLLGRVMFVSPSPESLESLRLVGLVTALLALLSLMLLWNVVRKQRTMAQMSTHIFSALLTAAEVT